jgi:glycosyltransferase involved in cell wall biosynthesis
MKRIVISGINIFEGGPLSVYRDFLNAIVENDIHKNNEITIFVHKKELFKDYDGCFEIIELPKSRKSYFNRCYYEYVYFHRYSKKEEIDCWISIHDMTPNVVAKQVYTYCHNATPFFKATSFEWKFNKTVFFFSLLYKFLYRINIKKTTVIVQQQWMRAEFEKMYGIEGAIVAYPGINAPNKEEIEVSKSEEVTFIYASYPRTFKNFEGILEACKQLNLENLKYIVQITLSGNENKYSQYLYDKYKDVENVEWIGLQKREALFACYAKSDCLIFPSKLETWGLPITEYKEYNKPIILSDLPYAHETLGDYNSAIFFNPNSVSELASAMKAIIEGNAQFLPAKKENIKEPFAENWEQLVRIIFKDGKFE